MNKVYLHETLYIYLGFLSNSICKSENIFFFNFNVETDNYKEKFITNKRIKNQEHEEWMKLSFCVFTRMCAIHFFSIQPFLLLWQQKWFPIYLNTLTFKHSARLRDSNAVQTSNSGIEIIILITFQICFFFLRQDYKLYDGCIILDTRCQDKKKKNTNYIHSQRTMWI